MGRGGAEGEGAGNGEGEAQGRAGTCLEAVELATSEPDSATVRRMGEMTENGDERFVGKAEE